MDDINLLLYTDGSLTEALRSACQAPIRVDVLREFSRPCTPEEQTTLGDAQLWQRDVVLSASTPLILARTRVGASHLTGRLADIAHLGTRPLGEWLFAQKDLKKTSFTVNPHKNLRDTLYQLDGATIWVQEIFI